ncbi:MAG TPA: S-adenosylmethionine:tRNA ribosyltransferase-isomerase [Ferruginibacter sp.]|nr:S-adenosylmethionine:tRNA ribosyltransferase-isomerase [Ferruginibacter sp.]HMP19581.1 S-adenosylmethionine:tRNA ribosyltransferase-isomerase [Ferruginibacter sp.]
MHPKDISIHDYTYLLPPEKIAAFPLAQRDASKLLVYLNGNITEDTYRNIAQYIPAQSLLVFNNTKVIQARLLFQKDTGGVIEIFCLEPYEALCEYSSIMQQKDHVRWKCMIGGAGKWKGGTLNKTVEIREAKVVVEVALVEKLSDAYVVELSWQPADLTVAEIFEAAGDMPLPPYIKRKAEAGDKERYQTVYAKHEGSVAAPTAGLHFTPGIFKSFAEKNITRTEVTLHVGAGTFKPVKAAVMQGHEMHAEWIDVDIATIQQLAGNTEGCTVAVGTTSLRTIESLYWMGVKALLYPGAAIDALSIQQWDVYEPPLAGTAVHTKDALQALQAWMQSNNMNRLFTTTQILIAPGYTFKVAKAIITNFHQPQSTLLLLVAAAIGHNWKSVYAYALENEFRFLSYGDGSLLFIE